MSYGEASKRFGIPKSTLYDQMETQTGPRIGRQTVLPKSLEDELCQYTLTMSDMFYGLTPDALRSLAYELADKNNLKHPFDTEKRKAGKDWMYNYLQRYPQLSLRNPEPTSMARAIGFRKTEVDLFYKNLGDLLAKHKLAPSRIYNCDETGLSSVQKPQRVFAQKGKKQVGKIVSGERGETTTVLVCESASGNYIPPMFIFKRINMNPLLMKGSPPGSIGVASKTGWINSQLFVRWLSHFIQESGTSQQSPALLILDNHEAHMSIEAYELCRKHGVIMLSLPPHTSHKLQPLDVTVFMFPEDGILFEV